MNIHANMEFHAKCWKFLPIVTDFPTRELLITCKNKLHCLWYAKACGTEYEYIIEQIFNTKGHFAKFKYFDAVSN